MTTTNEKTGSKMDVLAVLATITAIITGLTFAFYGAIISHFLSELSRLTLLGLTVFGGLAVLGVVGLLIYLGVNGAIATTKRGIETGYQFAFMNEQLNMAKANTAYRHAESRLVDSEAIAKQYQMLPISGTKGALIMVNGVAQLIPPFEQPSMAALPGPSQATEFLTDCNRLFEVFKQARTVHALIIGARDSGKSTLVNRLLNIEFVEYDTTIIDVLFNTVDSGWLLHDKIKISRDFVATLTAFYHSHKKEVDKVNVSRNGAAKRLLVIDEFPTLLANITDKGQKQNVLAMLRGLYSQGSHTNHNLMLLSQTVLTQDIELSSNDKGNFIQCAIGSLATDYLALRRGKAGKKPLYERLEMIAESTKYYTVFEDTNGTLDVQPLADLSDFGAKRLYGQAANEVVEESESMVEESIEPEPSKPTTLEFIAMSDKEKITIDMALELHNEGQFSLKLLHERLTGKQIGGKQSEQYKQILAKFGYYWLVEKTSTMAH